MAEWGQSISSDIRFLPLPHGLDPGAFRSASAERNTELGPEKIGIRPYNPGRLPFEFAGVGLLPDHHA